MNPQSNINILIQNFPDKVPIIFNPSCSKTKKIDKQKFLVPRILSMSELIHVIRKRINLDSNEAIFIFIKDDRNKQFSPNFSMIVSEVYEKYKSKDNILYITYANENTFG
jgi:GABA(A) receptor-associated protein